MQIHNMAFYSISVNNIGVYTSCTIWYNLDTPPAVPLKIKATMIHCILVRHLPEPLIVYSTQGNKSTYLCASVGIAATIFFAGLYTLQVQQLQ